MWNETYESQLLATKVVVNSVTEKLGATLIYPALGNHGKSRVDVFCVSWIGEEFFAVKLLLITACNSTMYKRI